MTCFGGSKCVVWTGLKSEAERDLKIKFKTLLDLAFNQFKFEDDGRPDQKVEPDEFLEFCSTRFSQSIGSSTVVDLRWASNVARGAIGSVNPLSTNQTPLCAIISKYASPTSFPPQLFPCLPQLL